MIAQTAFLASLVLAAHGMTINTPAQVRQCVPVNLSWDGGESPYFLQVLQGGSTTDTLVDLGQQSGTSYTWTTNLDPGTSITLGITDSSGETKYSDAVDITSGNGSSCEASGDSEGSASAGGSSDEETSAAAGTSSAAEETSSAAAATKSSGSAASSKAMSAEDSASSAASSAESETEDSAASSLAVSAAGLLGAGAVALLL